MVQCFDDGFFSLIDGPVFTVWFLGYSVVFGSWCGVPGSRCVFFFFFFFFLAIFCGCGGFGWWLVAVMVGGCGGCVIGRWMWWPAVLRIVGLRKRETEERERKNKK